MFSDRFTPEPLKPSVTNSNLYNVYGQNGSSGQRRTDALIFNGNAERNTVNGGRMNYLEKDKVKKDWLERLEEYTDSKCIVGFPGEKLREIQKENRNKFGEEFVEIILARFKMNYTVKVVYKLIQLLAKRRAKGTLLSDKKKDVTKKNKKDLTPIKEQIVEDNLKLEAGDLSETRKPTTEEFIFLEENQNSDQGSYLPENENITDSEEDLLALESEDDSNPDDGKNSY